NGAGAVDLEIAFTDTFSGTWKPTGLLMLNWGDGILSRRRPYPPPSGLRGRALAPGESLHQSDVPPLLGLLIEPSRKRVDRLSEDPRLPRGGLGPLPNGVKSDLSVADFVGLLVNHGVARPSLGLDLHDEVVERPA